MKNKLPIILLALTAIPLSVLLCLFMKYAGFGEAATIFPVIQGMIQLGISAFLLEESD